MLWFLWGASKKPAPTPSVVATIQAGGGGWPGRHHAPSWEEQKDAQEIAVVEHGTAPPREPGRPAKIGKPVPPREPWEAEPWPVPPAVEPTPIRFTPAPMVPTDDDEEAIMLLLENL